jgi:Ca2+/Na+ antiporter
MSDLSSIELLLSFVITWTVVLVPPAIIRLIRRKPLSKRFAITLAAVLYFANIILFTAMGSQSKSHGALVIVAIFCYYVLRWQTNASAARLATEQRKALGYDD